MPCRDCALLAFTNGLKLNAFHATDGLRTRIGTRSEKMTIRARLAFHRVREAVLESLAGSRFTGPDWVCLIGGAVKISVAVCCATGKRSLMGKKRKKMRGTVEKIIRPVSPMEPEKAQITIPEADDLYREVRVENVVTDESGEKAGLKPGAEVDVIVEADSSATMKKP